MTQAQFQGSKYVASWICKTFLQPGHQGGRFLIWSQEPVSTQPRRSYVSRAVVTIGKTWNYCNYQVFCVCFFGGLSPKKNQGVWAVGLTWGEGSNCISVMSYLSTQEHELGCKTATSNDHQDDNIVFFRSAIRVSRNSIRIA